MLTDAQLVDRVIAGFDGAFDELYRRHASSAWRLGQAVAGNTDDAADAVSEAFARVLQAVRAGKLHDGDAFRSYLLTATRNAALDGMRRSGRTRPTDDEYLVQVASAAPSPPDRLASGEDAALVAQAFRNLPERWRSVLWLTEVEGVTTKAAADQLGLSANGTAQLAVRARAGLRERFLQAHLRAAPDPACRFTVDRLGAYVGGGLSPRDLAKVDQHLAACELCTARKDDLEDLGSSLRRIVLPLPIALAGLSAAKVTTALTAASVPAGPGTAARVAAWAKSPSPWMEKLVAASSAGVLALGVVTATFLGDGDTTPVRELAAPAAATPAVDAPPPVLDRPALPTFSTPGLDLASSVKGALGSVSTGDASPSPTAGAGPTEVGASGPGSPSSPAVPGTPPAGDAPSPLPGPVGDLVDGITGGGDNGGEGGDSGDDPDEPVLSVHVGGSLDGHTLSVSASDSPDESGVNLDDAVVLGSPAPGPADDGLVVGTGGSLLGDNTVGLP